jgi:MFS family permease
MPQPSRFDALRTPGVPSLFVVAFLARMPHAATGIVLTLHVVTGLHRSYAEAGLVTAAATIGLGIGAPWRGRAVDRFGLRRAMLPSVVVESVVWAVAPHLGFTALIVAAFVGGLFVVPVFPITRQSLAVLAPEHGRDQLFALDAVSTEVTFMVGPVLGVLLATSGSTPLALTTIGGATAVAGIGLMVFNPPTRAATTAGSGPSEPWAPGRELLLILAASTAAGLVLVGTDVSIVAVLNDSGHKADVGWVVAVWAGGSMVGGLWYSTRRRTLSPFVLTALLAVSVLPAAMAHDPVWLAVALFVAGLPCAPALSAMTTRLVDVVPEHRRGEAMGWMGASQTIATTMGAPLVGGVIDHTAGTVGFAAAGILGVVGLAVGAAIVLPRRRAAVVS